MNQLKLTRHVLERFKLRYGILDNATQVILKASCPKEALVEQFSRCGGEGVSITKTALCMAVGGCLGYVVGKKVGAFLKKASHHLKKRREKCVTLQS